MTDFLISLMALMATFIQPANQGSLPTLNTTSFVNRGTQISEMAKSLNPPLNFSSNGFAGSNPRRQNSGPTGPTGVSGILGPTGVTGATGNSGPNTNRVPAENIRSGITMPNLIPQVALDRSRALQSTGSGFPLPPGQNN